MLPCSFSIRILSVWPGHLHFNKQHWWWLDTLQFNNPDVHHSLSPERALFPAFFKCVSSSKSLLNSIIYYNVYITFYCSSFISWFKSNSNFKLRRASLSFVSVLNGLTTLVYFKSISSSFTTYDCPVFGRPGIYIAFMKSDPFFLVAMRLAIVSWFILRNNLVQFLLRR